MTIQIIGAGLAGLLAGNMLRHRSKIFEKQEKLPNNHRALLRFRTGIFGTAIGIPFKKVRMIKAVFGNNYNPIKNELNYSMKTTGELRTDRSLPVGVVKEDRFIAPSDLIQQMASVCDIKFASDNIFEKDLLGTVISNDEPVISTIPMPDLMKLLDYPNQKKVNFKYLSGSVVTATVDNCDAYATYYFPDMQFPIYRASLTGNRFIIETTDNLLSDPYQQSAEYAATYYGKCFGLSSSQLSNIQYHQMRYAKILPIDDDIRKDFMHWATINFNIYSLGRFATWRPGLLLDDLVNDVSLISSWVMKGGKYNAAKHWSMK